MRKLNRGLTGFRRRGSSRVDRGAIGVLVAVLIGGGVLLGMGALAVDVGQIYQNRAELQNGADAAAMGIAKACAEQLASGGSTCALASPSSLATTYADDNASKLTGGTAGVDLVCGNGIQNLSACDSGTSSQISALTDCPPNPTDPSANFVDVHTSTRLAGGSTLLPPVFSRTLLGNGAFDGTNVKACAQAEWGVAAQSNSFALTISMCVWQSLTAGNKYGPNNAVPIYITGDATGCKAEPSGINVPGGFDWLQENSSGQCTASIDLSTSTGYSNTGSNISQDCQAVLTSLVNAYLAGDPPTVFLPVFEYACPGYPPPGVICAPNGGGNAIYYMIGLAKFVITGYHHMPFSPNSLGNYAACTITNEQCIAGYFEPGIDPLSDYFCQTNCNNFGVVVVKLTG